jgi:hypothetical protein
MDDLERALTETLQRTNLFGIENAAAISRFPKAVECFAIIQSAIDELEARGILRSSATGAKFTASERRAIRRHTYTTKLTRIAMTARDIERNDPTFVNKFRTPQRNKSDLNWLETGRAFAADLPAVLDKFTDYGYDHNFIALLIAEGNEFEDAINSQDSSQRQRIDSNASIDSIIADGLKALRTLKIIIPNIFSGNPGKLADWASASHVERRPKRAEPPPAITPDNK